MCQFFLYFTVNHLRVSLSSNYLPSLPIQIVLILQYQSNIWTHLHFVAFLYFYYLGIAENYYFFKYLNHKIAVYSKHKSANKKKIPASTVWYFHALLIQLNSHKWQSYRAWRALKLTDASLLLCSGEAKRKNTTEASSSLIDMKGCFTKPLLDF